MEASVNLLFLIGAFLLFLPSSNCQSWNETPFLSAGGEPSVNLSIATGGAIVLKYEEMEPPIRIAEINYDGAGTVDLNVFMGNIALLGPVIVREGGRYYLDITQRQDYENIAMKIYHIQVIIQEGSTRYMSTIFLNMVNIDDNPPVIGMNSCAIEELKPGISDCTYLVSDADGLISTSVMRFEFEYRDGDREHFSLLRTAEIDQFSFLITLNVSVELNFFDNQLHIFTIRAFDSLPNNGSIQLIVQVIDVPNMPPIWRSIFSTQRFPEKTSRNFFVSAVDGDTQINKQIKYRLENFTNPEHEVYFAIDEDTGELTISPINRDELKEELYPFQIIAYKYDNISWITPADVVIIIDDINDNMPLPNEISFTQTIPEETFITLNFVPRIIFNDIDLGENAQYTVELINEFPDDIIDAFIVIPNSGYQEQEFQIAIMDASKLDYDLGLPEVKFRIKATETMNSTHTGEALITINLENWNDEIPIFDPPFLNVTFNETEGEGYIVGTAHATDRDIGDRVRYSIVGTAHDYLHIDETTGVITVTKDDAFDFIRQREILVQIQAEDTFMEPLNRVFAQLTINLLDINNKQPQIQMPSTTPEVYENVPEGFLITEGISGSDPDSTAFIFFDILWDKSYALKQGRRTPEEKYRNCVDIITEYPDESKTGQAIGKLVAKEIKVNETIDFEEFEMLYLTIRLTDREQYIGQGTSEGMITIIIKDVNDNAPLWVNGSLETRRFVREEATKDIFIGNIQAFDIDGPEFNVVRYFIEPKENTPDNLVAINVDTGDIIVNEDRAIDADTPPRFNLYYTVLASDCREGQSVEEGCFITEGDLSISIIDTNNKDPLPMYPEIDNRTICIYENATSGELITELLGFDNDRDEIYHNVTYGINYDLELIKFFAVDRFTGLLTVELSTVEELDRDNGVEYHIVPIILSDNFMLEGDRIQRVNHTMVINVTLLDVNDNAPEMPHPSTLPWSILENEEIGSLISPNITAPDKDKPDTDNSRVRYYVRDLTAIDPPREDHPFLFDIHSPDNISGILFVNEELKEYWGTYAILLQAHDHGIPEMNSSETYEIVIRPYNYVAPRFIFPTPGILIRLQRELADPGNTLSYINNTVLHLIQAEDTDGLQAGIVDFEIVGPESEYFTIDNQADNRGRLTVKQPLTQNIYSITILAKDRGTEPHSKEQTITFSVRFVVTTGAPAFPERNHGVRFIEFEAGMLESFELPPAEIPINEGCDDPDNPNYDDCRDIFYFIRDESSKEHFSLDMRTRILTLTKELDRGEQRFHTIFVVASLSEIPPQNPTDDSILVVTVEVREADPKPVFDRETYTAGITPEDPINKSLLFVHATHSENLTIKYELMEDTMVADSSLDNVKDTAFELNTNTGELILTFRPGITMQGRFEFKVSATDSVSKTATANVVVFLVASNNKVTFTFENEKTEIENEQDFIAETLSVTFRHMCNIDRIDIANDQGVAINDQTDIETHFIDEDNIVVEASVINSMRDNLFLMQALVEELKTKSLVLKDIRSNENEAQSFGETLQIILIVVSTVLGVMCIVLLVAYCIRTRSLNNRLKNLSTTKFGSQDSGLNRTGVATVPGTNKHAIEGSNPVWKEEFKPPEPDTISNTSGDSDLIGVENNRHFA